MSEDPFEDWFETTHTRIGWPCDVVVEGTDFYYFMKEAFHAGHAQGYKAAMDEIKVTQDTSDGYHTFRELYKHRVLLWINLCLEQPEKCFWRPHYEGWPLLGMESSAGQITYHVQEEYLPLFKDKIKQGGPEWDGHTSDDVLVRLKSKLFGGE